MNTNTISTPAFVPGEQVFVSDAGQVDHGVVVAATQDSDGNEITAGQVAVRFENGQGTWGFVPGELFRIVFGPRIRLVMDLVPVGPDPEDPEWPLYEERPLKVGCYECGGFDGETAPARLAMATFTTDPADPTCAYRLVCGHVAL
jgi:hypothetical protein